MINLLLNLHSHYKKADAELSIAALVQGEIDALETARDLLGWPSIKSLVMRHWPDCPNRKYWLEAARRTRRLAHNPNIIYFLKTLQTVMDQAVHAAFSGRASLTRLTYKFRGKYNERHIRLVGIAAVPGIINMRPGLLNPLFERINSQAC